MGQISISELLQLPVAERIRIVEAIWDSIAAAPETLDLSEAERAELDLRWEAYQRDPKAGAPWAEVRARIARNG
jgi:putative addiction module component (TIGR02574 family)